MAQIDETSKGTTAWVYERIRSMILQSTFPPGTKVNQNSVAKEMGISRTPVANALHKLHSEGLVDSIPHTGFFVHHVTARELLDLFELREALDTMIISELAKTITDEEIAKLSAVFQPFVEDPDHQDSSKYRAADMRFHGLVIEMSRNALARRVDYTFQVFNRSFTAGLLRIPTETLPEHIEIVESLAVHDVGRATESVRVHNATTRVMLEETVENMKKLGMDPTVVPLDQFRGGAVR